MNSMSIYVLAVIIVVIQYSHAFKHSEKNDESGIDPSLQELSNKEGYLSGQIDQVNDNDNTNGFDEVEKELLNDFLRKYKRNMLSRVQYMIRQHKQQRRGFEALGRK